MGYLQLFFVFIQITIQYCALYCIVYIAVYTSIVFYAFLFAYMRNFAYANSKRHRYEQRTDKDSNVKFT